MPQLDWLHPWLFSHYWLDFGDLLRDPIAADGSVRGLLGDGRVRAGLRLAAWSRMTTKDVCS